MDHLLLRIGPLYGEIRTPRGLNKISGSEKMLLKDRTLGARHAVEVYWALK
jgi:hypothetical protein